LGFDLTNRREKAWDATFENWIRVGKVEGRDPNDIGDEMWQGSAAPAAKSRYLPFIHPHSVVLELGPGTGRYTRHVIGRCRKMILVDSSALACQWLGEYLRGKGSFEIHHIEKPAFPQISSRTVDFAFAHGVFEHLDLDDTLWFIEEFSRLLLPGSHAVFNFNNIMSPGGIQHLLRHRGEPGTTNPFRFYHPETMQALVETAGLVVERIDVSEKRFAFLTSRKPED
jgi:SAM-dependent methyltransferase